MRMSPAAAVSFLLVFVIGIAAFSQGSVGEKKNIKKEGDKKAQTKKIPLAFIYSTSAQEGFHRIGIGDIADPKSVELAKALAKLEKPTVFLIDGRNFGNALDATYDVFVKGCPTKEAVQEKDRRSTGEYWLVAFFGHGGSLPPALLVTSIEVSGKTIRFSYTPAGAVTRDSEPYLYWVPLGYLAPGEYTLELYDSRKNESTVLRSTNILRK